MPCEVCNYPRGCGCGMGISIAYLGHGCGFLCFVEPYQTGREFEGQLIKHLDPAVGPKTSLEPLVGPFS